jgi:cytochrome c-type biogenesis protein CcmH/NrfG
MMITKYASILVLAATLATPVLAAPKSDPAAMVSGKESVVRLSPGDGGAYIELAAAYQRAGRAADANNAFRQALALDNVMLETPTGDAIWSHEVARGALARTVSLTSR